MKRLSVITTGGTIAEIRKDGQVERHLTAAELLDRSQINIPDVFCHDLYALNSSDMQGGHLISLAQAVILELQNEDRLGIVVTTGTNTLEEVAIFLHTLSTAVGGFAIPVVITGAMRSASTYRCDGPNNLTNALNAASNPALAGVTVVFGGRVHAGWNVVKSRPDRLNAFSNLSSRWPSRSLQSLARDEEDNKSQPTKAFGPPPVMANIASVSNNHGLSLDALLRAMDQPLATVPIVPTYLGVNSQAFPESLSEASDALVIAALGDGQLPEQLLRDIDEVRRRLPVVVALQLQVSKDAWTSRLAHLGGVRVQTAPMTIVRAPARLVRIVTLVEFALKWHARP